MARPDVPVVLTDNALVVLQRRYLARDASGTVVETPAELLWRVATAVAAPEKDSDAWAARFYAMMAGLDFLPNSPALMNAGRELGQFFACFVLPVADTLSRTGDDGIFDSIRSAALIHKTGGGTGFSFSRLRPEGAAVVSTHGQTSGPISFMRVFNSATEAIHQGGFRRGANMGILRVDHPDILDFINLKRDPREMTNFNLSVSITDAFLDTIRRDLPHDVVEPHTGRRFPLREKFKDAAGHIVGWSDSPWSAHRIWDLICRRAWESGEPGILFEDRINAFNPTPQLGPMEATNPCGEMPLLPFEACNLGSINLANFVRNGEVDWDRLRGTIAVAVRFLDNVIDVNRYPKPQIEAVVRGNRKIGLGVMGWADLLFRLGIRYDSDAGIALGRRMSKFFKVEGWTASRDLALEKGSFPNHPASVFATAPADHPYWSRGPMRNATVTTIAPTGTLSIIAGVTGGIEPLYSPAFHRHVLDGAELPEVHPYFRDIARREGFWSETLAPRLMAAGSCRGIPEIPQKWRDLFACSHDIAPEGHLRMQAAFQESTDNAVSKTVNFPASATPDDVRRVLDLAVELGLKGVTVYRDGSRSNQPMALQNDIACLEC